MRVATRVDTKDASKVVLSVAVLDELSVARMVAVKVESKDTSSVVLSAVE